MITNYKKYNESLKDKLKGKSNKDILKSLDGLSDSDKIRKIIKNKLSYDLLLIPLIIDGNLECFNKKLTELPDNLTVNGNLYCYDNQLTSLPNDLKVNGNLYCNHNQLTSLPDDLTVEGNLYCTNNKLTSLPDNLIVSGDLFCNDNKFLSNIKKPKGVKGKIYHYNYYN